MIIKESIDIETGQYRMLDGIMHIRLIDKASREFSMKDANDHLHSYAMMRRMYKRPPELLDLSNFSSLIDMTILNHLAQQSYHQKKLQGPRAYLVNSMSALVQVDFYLKLSLAGYYTEIFNARDEAEKWLKKFIVNSNV